jgi:hypothetical protein
MELYRTEICFFEKEKKIDRLGIYIYRDTKSCLTCLGP